MKDELKLCICGREHKWGIVNHSEDNVPLYGARPEKGCEEFKECNEENRALTQMTPKEVSDLWSKTSFVNPQVPIATRKMIAAIADAGKGRGGLLTRIFGGGDKTVMERQWPEFMGLMISQLTDVRGAMVRDESKFAHLVAHTDEIVEAMRDVVGLKQKLETLHRSMDAMIHEVVELRREIKPDEQIEAVEHFGLAHYKDCPEQPSDSYADMPVPEALNAMREVHAPTRNEHIVTDAVKVASSYVTISTHVPKDLDVTNNYEEIRSKRNDMFCNRCGTHAFGVTDPTVCSYCGAGGPNPKPLKFVEGMGTMIDDSSED